MNIANITEKLGEFKKVQRPEDSIPLRVVSGLMALLCIMAGCAYTHTAPPLIFLYVWLTFSGSYVSYFTRRSLNLALVSLSIIGVLAVLAFFVQEMYTQFRQVHIEVLTPFVHVLMGLLVLHTFELRGRDDIELNGLIGLGLLCCTMVVARDLNFGTVIFVYVCLASTFFYLTTAIRSREKGKVAFVETASQGDLITPRAALGAAVISIAAMPVLTMVMFLCLPRMNSVFDYVADLANRNSPLAAKPLLPMTSGRAGINLGPGGGLGQGGKGKGAGFGDDAGGDKEGPQFTGTGPGGTSSRLGAPGGTGPGGMGGGPGKKGGGAGDKTTKGATQQKQNVPEDDFFMRNKDAAKYDDVLLMEVSAPGDFYYRRQVMDIYDGKNWKASQTSTISTCKKLNNDPYISLGGVPSLFIAKGLQTNQVVQQITLRARLGHCVPVASVPQQIKFPTEPLLVDDRGVVVTPGINGPDTTYEVHSEVPVYDLPELRKATASDNDLTNLRNQLHVYLQLPDKFPANVKQLAADVSGKDGNWFTKAERICLYLRHNYKYAIDASEPSPGEDLVGHFLFAKEKSGACGPFASSFVTMCRSIGLPSRMVGGFAPGELNGVTGLREIRGKHAHAWAEVYIPGAGWVPFDATPQGTLPAPFEEDTSMLAALTRNLAEMQANLTPSQATGSKGKGSDAGGKTGEDANGDKTNIDNPGKPKLPTAEEKQQTEFEKKLAEMPKTALTWFVKGLLVVGVIPMTLLLIQAIREGYSQYKARSQLDKDASPATILYLRVVEDLKPFKVNRLPSDTAEDISVRFTQAVESGVPAHPQLAPLLKEFVTLYTDDRFGNEGSEGRRKELHELSARIHTLTKTRVYDK